MWSTLFASRFLIAVALSVAAPICDRPHSQNVQDKIVAIGHK
jgi:hypothetical protein